MAMWVKRSEKEFRAFRAKRRQRQIYAVLIGVAVFLIVTFIKRGRYSHPQTPLYRSKEEIGLILPFSIPLGVFAGWVFYRLFRSTPLASKPMVVCPRCGTVKEQDAKTECDCSGHFEDIETMKKADDPNKFKN